MAGKISSGKVVHKEGKYFLEAEGKTEELSLAHASAAQLKELAGQTVDVIYSEPKPSVIGIGGKHCFILCYIPANPWGQVVIPEKELVQKLANKFLAEGLISKEIFDKIAK